MPMRVMLAAVGSAVLATVLAGIIGAAAAEAPTGTAVRTLNVQGVASAPIEQHATLAQADAAYRQAMGAALADGRSKAEFLAGSAGVALAAVQSIVEDGGYVGCTSESTEFFYEGEQPDFGNGEAVRPVPLAAAAKPSVQTVKKRRKKKKRKAAAKIAVAGSCQVHATVALGYALG
jgi:Protein of unknown function (DUF541)